MLHPDATRQADRRHSKFYQGVADELSLHVRHAAWLNTAPDKGEGDKSRAPNVSRKKSIKDAFKDDDYEPDMPPISCGHHVLSYLWKWGPTLAGSMGQMALTHDNLVACQSNTGIELSEWEAETLVRLSREYLSESSAASKHDSKPPFESADAARLQARRMEANLDAFFG